MKRALSVACAVVLVASSAAFSGEDKGKEKRAKAQVRRARINGMARETLDRLFGESPDARKLFDQAFGYAVFDNTKVAFAFTGGGGTGVAVEKGSGERTYMKMGTVGIGLGLGAQVYQVVFLFQDEPTFRQFVDKGWEAETQANAAAGTAGANAEASFTKGLAVYQLTQAGLLASADVAGTKYWKNKKLNRR